MKRLEGLFAEQNRPWLGNDSGRRVPKSSQRYSPRVGFMATMATALTFGLEVCRGNLFAKQRHMLQMGLDDPRRFWVKENPKSITQSRISRSQPYVDPILFYNFQLYLNWFEVHNFLSLGGSNQDHGFSNSQYRRRGTAWWAPMASPWRTSTNITSWPRRRCGTCACELWIWLLKYVYIYIYLFMYIYIYTYVYIHIYIYIWICIYIFIGICYICMCVVCVFRDVHTFK